jgi:hypothetical protein
VRTSPGFTTFVGHGLRGSEYMVGKAQNGKGHDRAQVKK